MRTPFRNTQPNLWSAKAQQTTNRLSSESQPSIVSDCWCEIKLPDSQRKHSSDVWYRSASPHMCKWISFFSCCWKSGEAVVRIWGVQMQFDRVVAEGSLGRSPGSKGWTCTRWNMKRQTRLVYPLQHCAVHRCTPRLGWHRARLFFCKDSAKYYWLFL